MPNRTLRVSESPPSAAVPRGSGHPSATVNSPGSQTKRAFLFPNAFALDMPQGPCLGRYSQKRAPSPLPCLRVKPKPPSHGSDSQLWPPCDSCWQHGRSLPRQTLLPGGEGATSGALDFTSCGVAGHAWWADARLGVFGGRREARRKGQESSRPGAEK